MSSSQDNLTSKKLVLRRLGPQHTNQKEHANCSNGESTKMLKEVEGGEKLLKV